MRGLNVLVSEEGDPAANERLRVLSIGSTIT